MNCLVSKLKAAVNNSDIEYLDGISVVCSPTTEGTSYTFTINGVVGEKVKVLDPSNGDVNELTFDQNGTAYISVSTTRTRVFFPVHRLKGFTYRHAYFDIGIFFEYNDFVDANLTYLKASTIGQLFGDLTRAFGLHTNVTEINVGSQAEITGELHDLAKRQVAAGRTSGNLTIYASNAPHVTVNGVAVGNTAKKIMFDSSVEGGYSIVNA